MIKLIINNQVFQPSNLIELEKLLNDSMQLDFLEIWIEGFGNNSLCVMINKTKAFLMYLRYKGDCGYSSRNLNGDNDKSQDFRLSNGQTDLYPDNWTVERNLGFESIKEYFKTGERYTKIKWMFEG